ncbi:MULTISPECIES: ATP-binding protein [unclassified Spirosoma]|uniref:sensor histidine kinase n=1 Tax=unclassified Spirosoma TaxID=2621999 RepID=UPI0009623259|nr:MULTISPECIES: ATP-binding protein [unclassified Spirosoma]MBN8822759.1 GHKL domain-containing protein [Spirosoma sp.]OJW79969.1 MAG: histidine kinase [Spirosoma sp. 48-14]
MNRRLLWLIYACLITNITFGQGIRITRGDDDVKRSKWRFKSGDNLRWADSAYNDRQWKVLVDIDATKLSKDIWPGNKAWFRQVITARPKSRNHAFQLVVQQFGASEIYLDGRLLAVLKPPRFDSGESQRLVQFIPLQLADTNRHMLAVRYQIRQDPVVQPATDVDLIRIDILPADQAGNTLVSEAHWTSILNGCFTGVFAILALLHFLFYRANRNQSINRTLAWTMLFFTLIFATPELDNYIGTLTYISITDMISDLSLHAGFVLLLTAVYQYLHLRRTWIYYTVVFVVAATQVYRLFVGAPQDELVGIPFILVIIDYIRVSWKGRKSKDADARLPWNSLKTALYCFLLIIVFSVSAGILESATHFNMEYMMAIDIALSAVAMFSIPVGLSLSLVRDYTRTYKALGDNLREVEQLSARTLAQEQEKQQILARQNELLEEQVQKRTAELHRSLDELKTTQDQLVQREKLASLGELTAGIAHEIQNPLNFVNNFAEVSVELVEELNEEREKPIDERDEGLETDLLSDLSQNVQKISDHGKRAASIVRGMLQHSRASSGQKQPTDLNSLVDEYLRLAYHGIRAKDKGFNAQLVTDFAPNLPTIKLVPEDIGRVLVNLFNNAFYAVQEKSKSTAGFVPTVSVQTAQDHEQLVIRIKDNGIGIPDEVRNKIFQPFFTTKPTGEGTGLGLSLSYDIVSKGHGGALRVETESGVFTEFIITLPD